jgi:hypothetical protein
LSLNLLTNRLNTLSGDPVYPRYSICSAKNLDLETWKYALSY